MKLKSFIEKVMAKAEFNSSRTEFYCNYKVGKAQRKLCESITDYTEIEIDGTIWYVKASFGWNDKQPVHISGICHQ